ncbi:hypothetical protein [Telmatospirillum sp. J64-1]|uniref:hypothetical protein n=1 Tax=Telmatospirillum sp. J64-1 TaxID=2502183 RepID=UPI00115CDEBC|nr:hypothetical protein [Telmatospirillum sp. J64-1]
MLPHETSEREHCCKALEALNHVIVEKPERRHDELVEAVRCLVNMRDWMIGQRRAGTGPAGLNERLEHVNSVLSILSAGSFPAVGMRHERLESARDRLVELMEMEPLAEADGNRTHHPR